MIRLKYAVATNLIDRLQRKMARNDMGSLTRKDFSKSYDALTIFPAGPVEESLPGVTCGSYGARFPVEHDLAPLFPYINAVADNAMYFEKPVYIKFILEEKLCAFYSREGAFAPVRDLAEALEFLSKLLGYLADISGRISEIIPRHKKFNPPSALKIYRLLPGSNCRNCGFDTCLAFAAALSRQYTSVANCPHLVKPIEEKATFPIYDENGKVVDTVSFDIDTERLYQTINRNEDRIQTLQSRLASFEQDRSANFAAANAALPAPLSSREIEVLRLIVLGATNREISTELNISQHTVKSHVIHIFNKIGVNDRAQASAWGAVHGLF